MIMQRNDFVTSSHPQELCGRRLLQITVTVYENILFLHVGVVTICGMTGKQEGTECTTVAAITHGNGMRHAVGIYT